MQNKKGTGLSAKSKKKDRFNEDLVNEVQADFEERRLERLRLERQWELNLNFLTGNQYCDLNAQGEIAEEDKRFFWQNHRVFNHIAPIVETRLAKFSRIQPNVYVRPKTDSDKDVDNAQLVEKFIEGVFGRTNVWQVTKKVNTWSEVCGSGFFKVIWDNNGGKNLGEINGEQVYEGDVKILAVSPFEIYPDSLYTENVEDCLSIIHARAVNVNVIKQKYGVELQGKEIGVFSLNKSDYPFINSENKKESVKNSVIVIEKYEKPSLEYPNGRLIIVAEDKLLYYGELPYINGENGQRGYPFVKQDCINSAGNFFGISVVERLIPVQRAFNAVKNRKHEFLNRLSMGIMTVEDGAIDTEELAEDGLSPGKILIYRQGSKAPEMLNEINMPSDFNEEETKLISEFVIISGVPDISSSTQYSQIRSGSALELLVEQDNERLVFTAEAIRNSYLEVAKKIVNLYAQFTADMRAVSYKDETGKTHTVYADKEVLLSDDVYLDSENEMLYTNAQKKEMIFKLYESGLLFDEQGRLRTSTKEKILTMLGYKDLDYKKGISRLQEEKAQKENDRLLKGIIEVDEFDDDNVHIDEHTRYVLSEYERLSKEQKQRFSNHVNAHKNRASAKV